MPESLYSKKKQGVDFLMIALLILLIILAAQNFVISEFPLYKVSGSSMFPTIEHADSVLITTKKTYNCGEIIVVDFNGQARIKRMIADEGDTIRFVVISDEKQVSERKVAFFIKKANATEFVPIDEPFINGGTGAMRLSTISWTLGNVNTGRFREQGDEITLTISEDCIFYMGDNRNFSQDSRSDGEIQKSKILGRMEKRLIKDSFFEKFIYVLYRNPKTAEQN